MTRRMGWLSAIVFTLMAAFACSQTDAGVTTKVKAKLAADDAVKAYQIDVDTRDKVVTLSGNVESEIAKTQASRLARETEGVARVVDNVTVTREPVDTPNMADRTDMTDPAITAAVKAKLLGDPLVAGLKIDVDTQSGVVTLSGTVKSAAEKEEAVRLARDTAGVKSVNDMIKVGA
jgi:hyperosmotically inducible periplasmic protein